MTAEPRPLPAASSWEPASEQLLVLACERARAETWLLEGAPPRIRWSSGAAAWHGLAAEPHPTLESVLSRYPEPARGRLRLAFESACRQGVAFDLGVERVDPSQSGDPLHLRWIARPGGSLGQVVGLLVDETAELDAAWRQRVQQVYLQAIADGQSLVGTLESLLEAFEARHAGSIGSILRVDQSARTIHHAAGESLPPAYREAIEGVEIGPCVGSCGTAAFRGERVVVGDIATDPLWRDYAAVALQHGLRACWSTPVRDAAQRVQATFAIYYREPRLPSRSELADIDALVKLVGLAMDQASLQENLRQLMDSASEVICVFDDRGRFVSVNKAAESVWGYPLDRLVGKGVELLVHQDDLAATREEMQQVMGGRPAQDFLNRNVTADGRVLDMQWSATWSAANRRMVCFGRDVTRQRAAQAQLRLLERATESSRNGVQITDALDPEHPVLYANAAMERMSGYPRSAFIGRNCRFLQGDDRDQPERARIRESLSAQQPCTVVLRNYRADGTLFWNELSLTPVRDDSGRVTHFLGVCVDVTERLRVQEELARATSHDAVTDLPRYAALEGQLLGAAAEQDGRVQRWWLLFIDLDRFHSINETLGDRVGDSVLRQMAHRLREALGGFGRLSRFAGDEFVAVLPGLDEDAVAALAESLRLAVAAPLTELGYELRLTVSIGISGYPAHGEAAGELLRRAEAAMAQAKRQGRDGVCFYSPQSMQEFEDRLTLGRHLHGAVDRGEIEIHYQPLCCAQTRRLLGFEALARWPNSPIGPVPPGRFIPVAEALGLMPGIGRGVLRLACAQLRSWRDAGLHCVPVAVNISVAQLLRPEFADELAALIDEYSVDAESLQLELTESSLMENLRRVRDSLDRLRAMGISLALDDFGTGYSSLAYLKRFAFDKLKIDRSFVSDLGSEGHDAALVRAVIGVGHELGMRVAAEGVETREQMHILQAMGCDELQGYLLGRPQAAEAAGAWLKAGRVGGDG